MINAATTAAVRSSLGTDGATAVTGTPPVDCLWKVDESTVVTSSSNGLVRVVSIQPNKVLGVLGDHDDFPVEGMVR